MCHFFPVHHFGMACLAGSKVNIQQYVCSILLWFSTRSEVLYCLHFSIHKCRLNLKSNGTGVTNNLFHFLSTDYVFLFKVILLGFNTLSHLLCHSSLHYWKDSSGIPSLEPSWWPPCLQNRSLLWSSSAWKKGKVTRNNIRWIGGLFFYSDIPISQELPGATKCFSDMPKSSVIIFLTLSFCSCPADFWSIEQSTNDHHATPAIHARCWLSLACWRHPSPRVIFYFLATLFERLVPSKDSFARHGINFIGLPKNCKFLWWDFPEPNRTKNFRYIRSFVLIAEQPEKETM